MANQLDIVNMAMGRLGQSARIATLTEQSVAAFTFNAIWDQTLAFVQSDAVWPWLLRAEPLALSADPPDPGWRFRYSRPNNCLTAYSITTEALLGEHPHLGGWCDAEWRLRCFGRMLEWRDAHGATETEILANVEDAWLVYAVSEPNPVRFPAKFCEALAARLAVDASGPLIGQAGMNNRDSLLQEYELAKNSAAVHDYNEGRTADWYETPSLVARG